MNNFLKIFPIIVVILALFLTQACAFAASPAVDASKLGTIARDVTYGTADGVALKMDILLP